jgi:WD40 repeat protein
MSRRGNWKRLAFGLAAAPLTLLPALTCLPDKRPRDSASALEGHHFPVQALAFGPNGDTLTSAAYQMGGPAVEVEVTDWDTRTGRPTAERRESLGRLRCLALAPGGRALVYAGWDRDLWRWDRGAAHERRRLAEPPSLALALALAPDGRWLVSSDQDCALRLWDAVTGEQRGTLPAHPGLGAIVFSPDGRTLASGDFDGVVKLWDVEAGAERAELACSAEEVSALAFAPDGRSLALALGYAVEVWDVNARRRLARLEGHQGKVKCLAFAPDGARLASGGFDRTVRLWDVTWAAPAATP